MGLVRALFIVLVVVSCAARAQVLLERSSAPGNTIQEYAVSTRCTIDEDGQLALSYRLAGDLGSNRVQQLQIPLAAVRANIRAASRATITTETYPVDAETWIYRAWKRETDGTYSEVTLREDNGGTGQKRTNTAPEALKLKNYLDLNCGGALRP